MTEHRKIPVPSSGKPARDGSLLERASGAFGLDAFRPAPMPAELASAPVKLARPLVRPAEPLPEPAQAPAPRAQAQKAVSHSEPLQPPVRFTSERHSVDRDRLKELGMIVPEAGATELLEEFRIIKRQVLAAAQDAGDERACRVLICSPLPGDGKTFCAANLAIAMAGERGREVVLVDADFAKPSVLSTLGLPQGPGLMDALADSALKVEDLVMATDIPGLFVLPAGGQSTVDSEWLASERTAEVLGRLTRGAPGRVLIFDSPPALAASPAAELARHVGQAILVARAEKTGRSALLDAMQLLGACPDIKLLLNAAHFSPSGRRFGTYYGIES